MVTAAPAGKSMRFNLPAAMNAIDRPSGDQNTDAAPSVPGIGRASSSVIARSHTRPPFPPPRTPAANHPGTSPENFAPD